MSQPDRSGMSTWKNWIVFQSLAKSIHLCCSQNWRPHSHRGIRSLEGNPCKQDYYFWPILSTGERRRRLTLSSSTPRCEDDCEDLRGAGGVLGGHWRRWRRALLGRSSSTPSSTADLGDLVAKFPQMEEVLQVNQIGCVVVVARSRCGCRCQHSLSAYAWPSGRLFYFSYI